MEKYEKMQLRIDLIFFNNVHILNISGVSKENQERRRTFKKIFHL